MLSRRRPRRRQLFCPARPQQRIQGNGRKYHLHLQRVEELLQRGVSEKKARQILQAYPVLVLGDEWLEELYCPECGMSHWCHVVRHDRIRHTVHWASRELWQQVAHVDPLVPNPSVSQFSRRASRRLQQRRMDDRRFFDPSC